MDTLPRYAVPFNHPPRRSERRRLRRRLWLATLLFGLGLTATAIAGLALWTEKRAICIDGDCILRVLGWYVSLGWSLGALVAAQASAYAVTVLALLRRGGRW